jgi:hypothetical protein
MIVDHSSWAGREPILDRFIAPKSLIYCILERELVDSGASLPKNSRPVVK